MHPRNLSGCHPVQPTPAFSSVSNSGCPPHSFHLMTFMTIWYLCLWPMPGITAISPPSRLYVPSSPLPHYPLGGTLWEVLQLSLGGRLLFGPVRSPRPLSLALETFPEEQDFLWRYGRTLICQTCHDRNCCPSSMADNPDFGLFGPPDGIAVFLIFYYYFSYLGLSRLRWSPVIISCQVYP